MPEARKITYAERECIHLALHPEKQVCSEHGHAKLLWEQRSDMAHRATLTHLASLLSRLHCLGPSL